MNLQPVLVILIPVLLVLAVGLVGSTRRLGFWWTLALAVVLTPVGGFLVAVLSGARRPKRPEEEQTSEPEVKLGPEPGPYGLPPHSPGRAAAPTPDAAAPTEVAARG